MSPATRDILTNREVLAVDQDSLGVEGWMVEQVTPGLQAWVKPLAGGARAVALLNRTDAAARIGIEWQDLGLARGAAAEVRDLWAHAGRGRHTGSWAAQVPSHGVVLVKLTPARGR